MGIEVPAVLFDSLDARQIVELFVTINAKHTRLNPSHIISLAGRKLYPDANQALAHDVIRSLNEDDTSPLHGEIKMLGTGRGRVSQAPLAEEIVDFFETVEKVGSAGKLQELRGGSKRFFLNYIKALSTTFPNAWAGRKYSIKTGAALRAFIRAAPDGMARARPDIFPDRADPHPLVEELRDLVKHRLALLPVRLPRLLPVERLDVGIGAARERSFDRHELGHPRGRVAVRRVDAETDSLQL